MIKLLFKYLFAESGANRYFDIISCKTPPAAVSSIVRGLTMGLVPIDALLVLDKFQSAGAVGIFRLFPVVRNQYCRHSQ